MLAPLQSIPNTAARGILSLCCYKCSHAFPSHSEEKSKSHRVMTSPTQSHWLTSHHPSFMASSAPFSYLEDIKHTSAWKPLSLLCPQDKTLSLRNWPSSSLTSFMPLLQCCPISKPFLITPLSTPEPALLFFLELIITWHMYLLVWFWSSQPQNVSFMKTLCTWLATVPPGLRTGATQEICLNGQMHRS